MNPILDQMPRDSDRLFFVCLAPGLMPALLALASAARADLTTRAG